MKTNLLVAIKNIIESPISDIKSHYSSSNRMNNMGETLELYIKDIFCNSLAMDNNEKNTAFNKYFAYAGNQNNPPDIIIKNGDAIEVKKIEGNSGISLNSSYPKDKIYSDNPMLTKDCRECEDWQEKDILYIIGKVKENNIKSLWFVYGDCSAANKETYERVKNKISSGLHELPNIEFAETNELGRVNRVDPLGITYLRIRGMWGIENPNKVFDYITPIRSEEFYLNAVLLNSKYNSFPESDKKALEDLHDKVSIKDVQIKSPNNPAKLLDAKLISFNL